jgi:uncharacterized protein
MTHPNAETIRKGFEAFGRGDMETARSIFRPNVIWRVSGHGPLSGEFHGFDEIARWGAQLYERSAGTFGEELIDILANDGWAFQIATYHAERLGRKIQDYTWNVFRMVDGQVSECWVYFGDSERFDDFWS